MKAKYVRDKPVPTAKKKLVDEIAHLMKTKRTVLVASIKGLPGLQFNEIKKQMRGKAEIRVAKKNIILRAIDKTEKGAIQELKKQLAADFALFFSDDDAFELSGVLSESQGPTKAKTGDIAPEDIDIEPGLTDLVPGPAISELSAVGLKIAVKEGKLEIVKGTKVVKAGEIINEKVAAVLGKLGIFPMRVGFIPLAAYDSKSDKVYSGIRIDKKATVEELKELVRKAFGFAVKMNYTTEETAKYFIVKAAREEKALSNIINSQNTATKEVQ